MVPQDEPDPEKLTPEGEERTRLHPLYPEEDRALLACVGTDDKPGVPRVRRLFFGVLAREGLRREELASLRWQDLDLERGMVRLDVNKTDDPRAWALDAGVRNALQAWHDRYRVDAAAGDPIFGEKGCALYVLKMAENLRVDLKTAGVKR